jgi:hypothetical protein
VYRYIFGCSLIELPLHICLGIKLTDFCCKSIGTLVRMMSSFADFVGLKVSGLKICRT